MDNICKVYDRANNIRKLLFFLLLKEALLIFLMSVKQLFCLRYSFIAIIAGLMQQFNIYPPDEVRQQSLRPETSSAPRLKVMDEMDDIFRRNGYNRKHAYDALFDDSEEVDGESPLRIESPGSWNR